MEYRQQRRDPLRDVAALRDKHGGRLPKKKEPPPEYAPTFQYETPQRMADTAARRRPRERARDWYVVVDEIVDERVTYEAWPWPGLSDRGHLAFDLAAGTRRTVTAATLHRVVADHRSGPAPERPLRIGDTFRVTARSVTAPTKWEAVEDVTQWARGKAQAAMYAMAAPRKPEAEAEQLEVSPPPPPEPTTDVGQAFARV